MFSRFLFGHLNFTSKRNRIPYIFGIFLNLCIISKSDLEFCGQNAETQGSIQLQAYDFSSIITRYLCCLVKNRYCLTSLLFEWTCPVKRKVSLMYVHHFILDLLANFLDFFTMVVFALTCFRYQHPFQKTWYRSLFIVINLAIAAVPVVPYIPLVYMILCFFYFFFVSSFRQKKAFFSG